MACPHVAGMSDRLRETLQYRQHVGKQRLGSAHDQIQSPFLRFFRRARHGGIHESSPGFGHASGNVRRRTRQGRGTVDHYSAGSQPFQYAAGVEKYGIYLRRSGYTEDHNVGVSGHVATTLQGRGAVRQQVINGLITGMIQKPQVMTGTQQAPGYAMAHQADADKANAIRL